MGCDRFYPEERPERRVRLPAFQIDKYPVTNRDFARFVAKNPQWGPGRPALVFADAGYLKDWKRRSAPGDQKPVIFVSWHAANAYCEWRGGRLPTVLEWEYAAAASEKVPNALKDPEFAAKILAGYARPSDPATLPAVGQGTPNLWGIHDLHGLIWEWTSDFNSIFVSGDNRQDGDKVQNLFCGNGATNASTREDYAAFMRYAMRSSLSADYTTANLGFRCVYDVATGTTDTTGKRSD
jgi:formylglycine-generating enzyme required for sulfatase activity